MKYDPQSAGINLQSPQSDSTPWTLTLRKGMIEHMQVIHGDHLSGKMLQLKGDDKEKFCTDRRFK